MARKKEEGKWERRKEPKSGKGKSKEGKKKKRCRCQESDLGLP
jgi:hypothetical protein